MSKKAAAPRPQQAKGGRKIFYNGHETHTVEKLDFLREHFAKVESTRDAFLNHGGSIRQKDRNPLLAEQTPRYNGTPSRTPDFASASSRGNQEASACEPRFDHSVRSSRENSGRREIDNRLSTSRSNASNLSNVSTVSELMARKEEIQSQLGKLHDILRVKEYTKNKSERVKAERPFAYQPYTDRWDPGRDQEDGNGKV